MTYKVKNNLWSKLIILIIFAMVLTGLRLVWLHKFNSTDELSVINGELDLRDTDLLDGGAITLAGEWAFYPNELLKKAPLNDQNRNLTKVPGDWSSLLNPEDSSPYGYGSYHLRILVDDKRDETYRVRIPSVRSASALYANGVLVGKSGEVGEDEGQSKARNVPYSSSSIHGDESGVIDIVLQVTNFVDPRSSGLVRAIKFGYEDDIQTETRLSELLQIVTAVIFFVHALFAILIFIVGVRDQRLIYFSIAIFSLALINLTGGDEKVLHQYIFLEYSTTYKLSMFMMILLSWAIVQSVEPQIKANISQKLLPSYTVLCVLSILISIFLPMDYLTNASNFTFGAVFFGAIIATIALLRSRDSIQGGIWIALAIVAITSHYIWWAYTMATGIKVVYYPVDLTVSIICIAGVWFKHYHQMHLETKDLAMRLQKADKEKDEFLINTSHELRNPLHSILNMSQAVLEREQSSLKNESVKNLKTTLSVSRHMSFMLDELLEMTMLKEGSPKLQLQPISMQAITEGVADMLYYMVKGKPVQIVNKVPADFPFVLGDENRVIQIIFNLLHNAVKYTNEGQITIRATIHDDIAYISIKDTGIGMDEKVIKTIFDPYVQGEHGQSVIMGGFGLGLNISKQLVELHGRTLSVDSDLGKGSTFTFSLPLAKEEPQEIHHAMAPHLLTATTEKNAEKTSAGERMDPIDIDRSVHLKDRPRVIVVDDDPINLEVVKTILPEKQYDVTTVLTGNDVLSLIDAKEWDLVISDVMMPHMSGYELTRAIRKRFTMSELPILLLTARSRPEDIENGFLSGTNDYVTKPIDAMELKSRVRALTEVKQLSRERLRLESAWLQAQIKPHFLFNTLNSIIALSEIDVERMQKLLDAFSDVLRGKFNFQNTDELVPIDSELNLIQSYLYIEKERFGDRLHVTWEIEEDLQFKVPSLSIQPLVENAIEHGIMKRLDGGEITVRIVCHGTYATVYVKDDGVGIDEQVLQQILEKKPASKSGVGLLNTNLRLERLFGEGLQINSIPDLGTTVSFKVPYK